MTIYVEPGKWLLDYQNKSTIERYRLLLDTLDEKLTDDFVEEIDLVLNLLNCKEELLNKNKINLAFNLVEKFKKQLPGLYKDEFPFFEDTLVKYYLFKKYYSQVKRSLELFYKYPFRCYEKFMIILDLLVLYRYSDEAINLVRNALSLTKKQKIVDENFLRRMDEFILISEVEDYYKKGIDSSSIEWDSLLKKSKNFGLNMEIVKDITEKGYEFAYIKDMAYMEKIFWYFLIYMFEEKSFEFNFSYIIWREYNQFLEDIGYNMNSNNTQKSIFIDHNLLKDHIKKRVKNIGYAERKGVAVLLWGIPYIYGFLKKFGIITTKEYDQMIENVVLLKKYVISNFGSGLWQYGFINTWD